jgi:hypothetical protein
VLEVMARPTPRLSAAAPDRIPYAVDQPQVVPAAEVLPMVRPSRRRVWRRLGIERFLRLRAMGGRD